MTHPTAPNIVDIAASSPDFDILVRALTVTGLADTVRAADDITVFAPTDAAFTQLALDLGFTGNSHNEHRVFNFLVQALGTLGDPIEVLTDVLLYHVAPGAQTAIQIRRAGEVETLLPGATFGTKGNRLLDNEPDLTDPRIVARDLAADNGIIQVINRVLIPLDIDGNTPDIVEVAQSSDDFDLLVQALTVTGLVDTIKMSDDITVFAPTDAAFAQLAADLGYAGDAGNETQVFDFLVQALGTLGDPVALLTDVLLYHVSPGAQTAQDIRRGNEIDTLLGETIQTKRLTLIDNEPDLADPEIVVRNIEADNGIIQAIDRVLLPIDIPGNEQDEKIVGTLRADHLTGGGGDDKIHGRAGADVLDGGSGDDWLSAGRNNDLLIAGAGDDVLTGGKGRDTFDFADLEGHNTIIDFGTHEFLVLDRDEFHNFRAVKDASWQIGSDVVIEGDEGSIRLDHFDLLDLSATNVLFV